MKIFGLNIETPRQIRARHLYHKDLIQSLQEKNAEEVFVAYLNGVKDGCRMAREDSAPYLKAALDYQKSTKIH